MSYKARQVFTCGIASGASTSSSIDLGGSGFQYMFVNAVTMSTGAEMTLWGSADNSTFYRVMERVNTAPVQYQNVVIATTTSGGWAQLNAAPFRYVLFTASAVVSGGVSITVAAQD